MALAKKKTATKTAKKQTARGCQARKKTCTRTAKQQCIDQSEKMHVYIVTALAMITGILLCANAAIMMA